MQENKHLSRKFWRCPFWARGYFVATSGNITDEIKMEYIQNQDIDDGSENEFTTVELLLPDSARIQTH